MFPSFSVFGYEIGSYGICVLAGIAVAALYVALSSRMQTGLNSVQLVNTPVVAGLGAFLGAHILYALTHLRQIIWVMAHPGEVFSDLQTAFAYFLAIFGGMVFYGGLIGGLIAGYIYLRHRKLDVGLYADTYAPAIPLFHAFGRIGCFLGGCCYGIESSWGFVYTAAPIAASNGVVRLPIQLIEAAGDLLIFAVLHLLSRREIKRGMLLYLYLILYPLLRFTTEFFRGDEIRGFFLCFSTSQWISILLLLFSCIRIFRMRGKDSCFAARGAEKQNNEPTTGVDPTQSSL